MTLAQVTAKRTTCVRRAVGCVLLDAKGQVLSTGYNGVASGLPHCNDRIHKSFQEISFSDFYIQQYPHACQNAFAPSGSKSDCCEAIHAEQNALMQCQDVQKIHTCYVTLSPCLTCVKLLMNTSCQRIVFAEEHYHIEARELWAKKWQFTNMEHWVKL